MLRAFLDFMLPFVKASRKLERDTEVTCGSVLKYYLRTCLFLRTSCRDEATGEQAQLMPLAQGMWEKMVKEICKDKWYFFGLVTAAYLDIGGQLRRIRFVPMPCEVRHACTCQSGVLHLPCVTEIVCM